MPVSCLPINDILICHCNQELEEQPAGQMSAFGLPGKKHEVFHQFGDRRYISGKLRRLQRVDRQVEWAKVVAAIHEDCIIHYSNNQVTIRNGKKETNP